MDSSLKAAFARLGPTEVMPRVESGSPAELLLEWAGDIQEIKTIPAILALAKRGMPMIRAKRAVEAMVDEKRAFASVPTVESLEALTADLQQAGVKATVMDAAEAVDVKATRERLHLTQEQFAIRYGLDIDAVRNWEHGRRKPDTAARSYLRAISNNPGAVEAALWACPTPPDRTPD